METVNILRRFIKAERRGDWTLHLQTVQEMLPYLAASGHSLYAKYARIYLQHITELQIVRRTDRYCGGLSINLILEQVLMHNLKTSGGLTRGRGMTEMQRLIWLMSTTSEQHKDLSESRQDRDTKDIALVILRTKIHLSVENI